MRKVNLALCALALSIASVGAQAVSSGTVTFKGKLIGDTCELKPGSEDIVVTLPTLSTSELAAAGAEKGSTNFDIQVENCDASITKVAAHFEAINSSGANPVTGNLVNTATAGTEAKNAEVRLYNISDSSQIRVGSTGESVPVDPVTHAVTFSYAGGYYATAATTPGDVLAQVQYVLAYP
jgi:major type 1 subunit fimbrin (pilin)